MVACSRSIGSGDGQLPSSSKPRNVTEKPCSFIASPSSSRCFNCNTDPLGLTHFRSPTFHSQPSWTNINLPSLINSPVSGYVLLNNKPCASAPYFSACFLKASSIPTDFEPPRAPPNNMCGCSLFTNFFCGPSSAFHFVLLASILRSNSVVSIALISSFGNPCTNVYDNDICLLNYVSGVKPAIQPFILAAYSVSS